MVSRETLLKIYWRARDIIAPSLLYSQEIYERVLNQHVSPEMTWLDLGCGHQILPAWRQKKEEALVARCRLIVGIDSDRQSLLAHQNISIRVEGDITRLPFKDACFDLITANMVVEHLDNPAAQFNEISRVLRPGGFFIFHTPNARGYFSLMRRLVPQSINNKLTALLDGRKVEDVFPVHYRANTRKAIGELAKASDLEVVEEKMIVTDAVFSVVPPLMVFELVLIRALMTDALKPWRTNIIAILRKGA
jgi:ubiquinone/menaquinone biosynthesis C-methylase UbiE